jgi:SPP1 gp7 family putative phage head morphogenesis protein
MAMSQIVRTPKLSREKSKWAKNRDVYLQGLPLNYSAALRARYEKELRTLVMKMATETQRQVIKLFKSAVAKEYFEQQEELSAMDESISSSAKKLMNKLYAQFYALFASKADDLAKSMVNGADKASKVALKSSISQLTGGLTLKTNFIPAGLKEVVKSSVSENVSLIKSIPEKYFTDITGSVMRSITAGAGVKDLVDTMKKYYGETDRRAKNVALDQTRKAYNSINKQRMMAAGYTKFKWLHSGGGQHPRKDHIAMSGNVYSFDDLPVIDQRTGERGIPGQAINCGCTMQPVYEFTGSEVTA